MLLLPFSLLQLTEKLLLLPQLAVRKAAEGRDFTKKL